MKVSPEKVVKASPANLRLPENKDRLNSAFWRFWYGADVEYSIAHLDLSLPGDDESYLHALELARDDAKEKRSIEQQKGWDFKEAYLSSDDEALTLQQQVLGSLGLHLGKMNMYEREDLREGHREAYKKSGELTRRIRSCETILQSYGAKTGNYEINVRGGTAKFAYEATMQGIKLMCGNDQQRIDEMLRGIEYDQEIVRCEQAVF